MKKLIIALFYNIFLLTILSQYTVAQTTNEFFPATSNVPGSEFPKVSGDFRVMVRLKAPEANKVQVQGGDNFCKDPMDLDKDADGNWRNNSCNGTRFSLLLVCS
jgi:hypothetical protein